PSLHTSMYFFIANLAMLDIMCSSSVLPQMLENLMQEKKTISLLLTIMSYDQHVAICHPLRYINFMSKRICISLAAGVWLVGVINSLVNTLFTLRLDFCGPNLIKHFFCEFPPILALSCSSIYLNQIMMFMADIFLAMGNFLLTTVSYSFIIINILKIQGSKRKQRAFSTCSSHLLVVTLFYSSIIYTYIRTTSSYSLDKDKMVAVMYTLVIPILNPLIYSLHNREVKIAFRKIFLFAMKL
ncbi:olfactory receptor 13G1-like, partial [Emydura macquarii macquarii]|uniref:olfactory receptor 13G1-like n=1 Tax=Emydura macquarii macquarii TaxID=1129001 RepID=UPI00352B1557